MRLTQYLQVSVSPGLGEGAAAEPCQAGSVCECEAVLIYNRVPFPFLRILLTFVSIFSLYSVHLLLKTANEGGTVAFLVFLSLLPLSQVI